MQQTCLHYRAHLACNDSILLGLACNGICSFRGELSNLELGGYSLPLDMNLNARQLTSQAGKQIGINLESESIDKTGLCESAPIRWRLGLLIAQLTVKRLIRYNLISAANYAHYSIDVSSIESLIDFILQNLLHIKWAHQRGRADNCRLRHCFGCQMLSPIKNNFNTFISSAHPFDCIR